MKPYILLLTLVSSAGFWFPEIGRAQGVKDPTIAAIISHLSDSGMYQTISVLQGFGTRYTFASTQDSVARWVRNGFVADGLTDVMLDTLYSGFNLVNVVATMHGASESEIVVGAHYDSYSDNPMILAPGADDNATGVSAVMEMARVLSTIGYTPGSTIRFVAFTGEEVGLWGSAAYAQKAKDAGRDIRAVLNLDNIGFRNPGSPYVGVEWYQGSEELRDLTSTVVLQYTALTPVLDATERWRVDSYSFASLGYRTITWLGQASPFYHTTNDLLDYLDVSYAGEIARSALAVLLTLDKSTDVQRVSETLPAAVRLNQNYPNPFNPTTVISYQLPVVSNVKLAVYDLLGREVSVLVNERKNAGSYEVTFNAAGLSSGVYFYRITAGDFVQSKKLVIAK